MSTSSVQLWKAIASAEAPALVLAGNQGLGLFSSSNRVCAAFGRHDAFPHLQTVGLSQTVWRFLVLISVL